jgi:uncharacterized protein (TIGR00369 family)
LTATSGPAGDGRIAGRLADASLADVPLDALRAGLRLPLHDHLGLELTGLHPTSVELPLSDRIRSTSGPLHGGVAATVIDVTANVAVATSGSVDITAWGLATTALDVRYHAQPRTGPLRCTATVTDVGRRTVETRCELCDAAGRRVATGQVTTALLRGAGVAPPGLSES